MSDRTIIDAMALRIRQVIAPVDLDRDREFRDRFNEAGRIVLEYVTRRMAEPAPSMDVDSPELTDDQLSRLRPARGPGELRLIEADELIVTTRDVDFAMLCQRACGDQRPVHFNGLDFRVTEVHQAGFENRWVLKLLRWKQMGPTRRLYPAPAADVRLGTTETFIDVTNTNGSGIRVEFKPSQYVAGVMLGEAQVKFVEIEGDPHHGLSDEQWAFFQTLQEAHIAGQTLTFDFGGKTYTGVRITSLTKEA